MSLEERVEKSFFGRCKGIFTWFIEQIRETNPNYVAKKWEREFQKAKRRAEDERKLREATYILDYWLARDYMQRAEEQSEPGYYWTAYKQLEGVLRVIPESHTIQRVDVLTDFALVCMRLGKLKYAQSILEGIIQITEQHQLNLEKGIALLGLADCLLLQSNGMEETVLIRYQARGFAGRAQLIYRQLGKSQEADTIQRHYLDALPAAPWD